MACIDWNAGPVKPVRARNYPAVPNQDPAGASVWQRLVDCPYFQIDYVRQNKPFALGSGRMQALVVCPAALRDMWQKELASATIAARVLSQEEIGQGDGRFDPAEYAGADVIVVDESHNFRNRNAQRYANLELLIGGNGGKGQAGGRKKLILLTAAVCPSDWVQIGCIRGALEASVDLILTRKWR